MVKYIKKIIKKYKAGIGTPKCINDILNDCIANDYEGYLTLDDYSNIKSTMMSLYKEGVIK